MAFPSSGFKCVNSALDPEHDRAFCDKFIVSSTLHARLKRLKPPPEQPVPHVDPRGKVTAQRHTDLDKSPLSKKGGNNDVPHYAPLPLTTGARCSSERGARQ